MSVGLWRKADRPSLGRRSLGPLAFGPDLELPPASSLLVVGPTQVGKTSSLVIPAILRWRDALVVTSVKSDVVAATSRWRATVGDVQILEPGASAGCTWDPLEDVTTFRRGVEVARDLTLANKERSSGETEFWNTLAVKLLGALFVRAHQRGETIHDVVQQLEQRLFHPGDLGVPVDAARVLEGFFAHAERTRDAVATTAEAMMLPWHFVQPLARVRGVVAGANTLYLCAPRSNQRHYEGLFTGALRTVLDEQQRRHENGRARRLLVVLDEAAAVSPLDDLDQLAATMSGMGVTLVSVFQDFAQIEARWPSRAQTIVNNHATRIVLGGLVDSRAASFLPEIFAAPAQKTTTANATPPSDVESLRQWPRGSAVVVSGRLPLFRTRLRPWWRDRALRNRGDRLASG